MGVLHPFSAASKPMQDWDAMPSRPLPFAATLHTLDLNAQPAASSSKIPRPRRHDVPSDTPPRPTPASTSMHARYGSVSTSPYRTPLLSSPSARRPEVGSDDWMQMMVAHCVDNAKCDLELSDYGLERLSTKISDLQHLVTLPPIQSPTASPEPRALENHGRRLLSLSDRSFSRTQSAPASASFFSRLNSESTQNEASSGLLPSPSISSSRPTAAPARQFKRTVSTSRRQLDFSKRVTPSISIFLSQNRLRSLPSALFEIQYLTVLTLRSNQLRTLPAAIGELVHLKELNISNNKLEFLPATIVNLSLEQFSAHNNNWLLPPVDPSADPSTPPKRILSPTRQILRPGEAERNIPRLTSLCLSVLLSPRGPNDLPPLLGYDWDGCNKGGTHPLLDPRVLREFMPALQTAEVARVLQAVRSACATPSQPKQSNNRRRSSLHRPDALPRSYLVPEPDDASTNPFYSPCPSPRHRNGEVARQIFLDASETRFEWVDICGEKDLPILWRGCSPGCLAFLDDECAEEEEEDGFSLEGLDLGRD